MITQDITPSELKQAFRKNLDARFNDMIEIVKKNINTGLRDFINKPTSIQLNTNPAHSPSIKFSIGHTNCKSLPSDEVMKSVIQSYRDEGFKCTYELVDGDRSYDYYIVAFYEND